MENSTQSIFKLVKHLFISFLLITVASNAFAQLDTEHYFAPMHATSAGGFIPIQGDGGNQYLYLSTPSTTPITVTVTDGAGAVITTATISNTSPFEFNVGTGQSTTTKMFVDQTQLNTPLSGRGLIITGAIPFTATFKTAMSAHAEMMTSKGKAAKGKTFRGGSIPLGTSGTDKGFFTSFIATEPGTTTINVSGYNPAVEFDGSPIVTADNLTITLQQGESYVLSGTSATAANQTGFIGALITSDKDIVVQNGALLGNVAVGAIGQDAYFDQSAPVERLGTDYILINGGGDTSMELPIVIAHTDNTQIFVNGGTAPIATINAGEYFVVPNSNYSGINMYVKTSQPAYVYQALSGGAQTNGGMMFVPPFNCYLPNQINIPKADGIGTSSYTATAMLFTQQGSTVTYNGTVQTGGTLVPGTAWESYKFGISGNVELKSTGAMSASLYGAAGTASYAGTYAGFSSIPSTSIITYDDTCFQASTSFVSIHDVDSTITGFIWDFGDPVSLATTTTEEFPTHVFSTPGTYTVNLVITRTTCNDTVNQAVTIIDGIPALLSGDATVCLNAAEPVLTFDALNGTAPYTFTYNINNGPSQTITAGSSGSITLNAPTNAAGTFTYYLTGIVDATGPGICSAVSDSAVIVVTSDLPITVNTDSLCFGESVTLTASGATTYSWAPATELNTTTGASVICTPSTNRTYTITGTSGTCVGTTETTVVINPTPSSNAGADISICSGDTGLIGAPATIGYIYSWSPATNLSNATDANPTVSLVNYTASPIAVEYIVTTSPAGCFSTDTVMLTVNPSLDPDFAYSSATFCQAGGGANPIPTITTVGGAFTAIPAGLSINSSTGEIDLATSTLNTYTVTYTHGGACPSSSSTIATITNLPDANFSFGAFCQDSFPNPTPLFPAGASAGVFSANPALIFTDPATGEIDLAGSTAGTYTVTNTIAAGGGCPSAIETNTITITAIPIINIENKTICIGESVSLIPMGANSYSWSDGSNGTTLNVSPTSTISYTVMGTTSGCSSTVQAMVEVNPIPALEIPGDTICQGDTVKLIANGATTYLWSDGITTSNTYQTNPSATTSYTVTGYGPTGCSISKSAEVLVNPLSSISTNAQTICEGTTANLTASGGSTYIWVGLDTAITNTHTITGTTSTTYTVYGSSASCTPPITQADFGTFFPCYLSGCPDTATARITVTPLPIITVNTPATICKGESTTLTATGGASLTWSTGQTGNTISVSPLLPTTYTVTDNTPGCGGSATTTVTVNPPTAVQVNSAIICDGETAILTASGAEDYSWSDGTIGNSKTVAPTTSTSFTVTGNPLACPGTAITTITVNPSPTFSVTSATVCVGFSATLTAEGADSYIWENNSTANSINVSPTKTKVYAVTGRNSIGCTSTIAGRVTVVKPPKARFTADPTPAGVLDPTINFTDRSSSDVNGWFWTFGDNDSLGALTQNPTHTYPGDTASYVVTLVVSNAGSCYDTVAKSVEVGPEFTFYMPSAFSPNEDEKNEDFGASGEGIVDFELLIFDRWGQQLFKTTNLNGRWKGDYLGIPCQQDTYIWKVFLKDVFKKEHSFVGTVTIVK